MFSALAMQSHRGKRVRSLASQLLGESDCDEAPSHVALLDDQNESSTLKKRIEKLERQSQTLKDKLASLKDKLARVSLQLLETQKYVIPLGGVPGVRALPVTPTSWIEDNPQFLDLPRMHDFLDQWDRCPYKGDIYFNICKQSVMTASCIFQHCEWVISRLFQKHPAVYKIGITENVISRWVGKSYSYKCDPHDDWQQMDVLFVGNDSLQCGLVEAHLISRFLGRSGCRNVQRGGETAKPGPGPFFTYVVWKSLAPPQMI